MEKRKLGRSSLSIVPFILGGNVFGWTIDEARSFEVLDAFVAAGFSMIDTADVYSNWFPGNKGGESENIIGKWMKSRGNRAQVHIATKVGGDMGAGKNLKKDYIISACEASLRRLQTDHIDLYQSHWDDLNTPPDETLEAYAQLIREGKVNLAGASNFSAERLSAALQASDQKNLPRYQTFQPRYNLYDRQEFETEYQQLCIHEEISVIPYYGLASGFLSGKYRTEKDFSKSARGAGMHKYMNDRGFRVLDALDKVAAQYHVPQATIALAWLLDQPAIAAPIASATSKAQLLELVKCVEIKLDQEALRLLDGA